MKAPVDYITYSKEEVLEAIRKKAKEVLPEGYRIRLFGSRARGDEREDSDWDIHILIPGEERLPVALVEDYAYPIENMGWDMGIQICIIMHSYRGWKKRSFLPLYKNIESEGIDL